jgi:hypothetical protein
VDRCTNGLDQAVFLELVEKIKDAPSIHQILSTMYKMKMVDIDIIPIQFVEGSLEILLGEIPCPRTGFCGNDGFIAGAPEPFTQMALGSVSSPGVEKIDSQV